MLISKFTNISTTKACFHCENIGYVKLTPHADASGLFFRFMHRKPAGFETEVITDFTHQVWENASLVRQLFIIVSVHKNVFSATVTVQIQIKYDFTLFLESSDETFSRKIFRVQLFVGVFPSSVKILASQTASIISIDDTVGIQHGNNFEHKAVS